MRAVLVCPFVLPRRPELGALLKAPAGDVSAAVAVRVAGFTPDPPKPERLALIDHHESAGAARLERWLLAGTASTELGPARAVVSPLGTGALSLDVVAADFAELPALEAAALSRLQPTVGELCEALDAALEAVPSRTGVTLPPGRPLWVHRVLVDGPAAGRPDALRYGRPIDLGDGTATVADGYTAVDGACPDCVADAVAGVVAVSEEWLLLDDVNRELAAQLVELDNHRGTTDRRLMHAVDAEVLRITGDVALRQLVLDERNRYLANGPRAVRDAAFEVWRMREEQSSVETRVTALRELVDVHRERLQSARDDSRNSLLLTFTLVTFVTSLFLVFDFVTHEGDVVVGPMARLVFFGAVLTAVVLIVGAGLVRRGR